MIKKKPIEEDRFIIQIHKQKYNNLTRHEAEVRATKLIELGIWFMELKKVKKK